MNKTAFSVSLLLFAALGWAQDSPQAPAGGTAGQGTATPAANPQSQSPSQLPAGVVIPAELAKSVDAKKAKPGDKIEARTTTDLLSHGDIVVPRNTKIIGHVTGAKGHTKDSPDSMIEVAFDRMLMKGGQDLPLQASVQAIGRPLLTSSTAGNGPVPDSGGGISSGGGMGQRGGMGSPMGGASRTGPPTTSPTSYPSGNPSGNSGGGLNDSSSPLDATSQGVIGFKSLSLSAAGQGSVISSKTENVHLESGTQLILKTQ